MFAGHCGFFRRACRLRRQHLVQAKPALCQCRTGRPADLLLLLVVAKKRKFRQPAGGVLSDRAQYMFETPPNGGDRLLIEEIGCIFDLAADIGVIVLEVETDFVFRGTVGQTQGFDGETVEFGQPCQIVLEIEFCLKQRRHLGQGAFWIESLDDPLIRHVLVRQAGADGLADTLQQAGEIRITRKIRAQHQRVDQGADHRLGFRPVAVCDFTAHHDVVAVAIEMQHQFESGKKQDVEADIMRPCQRPQLS